MKTVEAKGIGGHQSANMRTDEWITPPEVIKALGLFDLDPCAHVNQPWPCAYKQYTKIENGLLMPWDGNVWLNPPYGREITKWLKLMNEHNNGVALVFGRTDRRDYHDYVFSKADSILFLKGRLTFYTPAGTKARANGGAPNILIAYGEENSQRIADSRIQGWHAPVTRMQVIIVGVSPSWKNVVSIALTRMNGEATIKQIYDLVETIAPDKILKNENWKEKVRQKLQLCFNRIRKGTYALEMNETA